MTLSLEAVFEYQAFGEAADVIERLVRGYPDSASLKVRLKEGAPEVSMAQVPSLLRAKHLPAVHMTVGEGSISFGEVAGHRLARLDVMCLLGAETDGDKWLGGFLDDPGFVQARVYDHEYDFWQNASDPLQYTARGRSTEGLPTISNGLPFPLEQVEIDISGNPGRWQLREGYIEAIGSTMWLGKSFPGRTGAQLDALKQLGWLRTTVSGTVLRLQVEGGPWVSDRGAQAEQQRALRSALYRKA